MKPSQEIALLERITGGDPEKALRNRRVKRAIQTIRSAWAEEPGRAQTDLNELLNGTVEWRWPLKVYSHRERQAKEDHLRGILKENIDKKVFPLPLQGDGFIGRFLNWIKWVATTPDEKEKIFGE